MRLHDHRQVRAFLAAIAPLGLASGCSDLGEFDGEVCVYQPSALSDLKPSEGVDYIGLRSLQTFADPPSAPVVSEWGVPCDTASDPAACSGALADLAADGGALWTRGGFDGVSAFDVVFTAGDEAVRVTDISALIELLGLIDTPNEALLVAHANGHEVTCGEANWRQEQGGYTLRGTRGVVCGGEGEWHYEIIVAPGGTVTTGEEIKVEDGNPNCAIGRRPDGLCSRTRMTRQVGGFFANAAHLEAASVPAFARLARELVAHGAPRNLVRAAWQARREEIRHARATAALARRFGAAPIGPRVQPRPLRSLLAMALDNATEGCVRETFGAVTAAVQAKSATDPTVRRTMRSIARDEANHATLSWAIDAWAQTKLSAAERRALRAARDATVAELGDEAMHRWSPSIRRRAGMPGVEAAMRMLEPMTASMWRA
jgi:hypothetical protein